MATIQKTDPSTFQDYLKDASNFSGQAARVVIPSSESEVVEICREVSRKKIPLTISGARTGLVGGAIPEKGWVLSTENLLKFEGPETTGERAHIHAGSGRLLAFIHKTLAQKNWLYPPDPTEWNASVGGTISTNASGARYYKYGSTREYVTALRMVLMNGDVVSIERGTSFAQVNGAFELSVLGGARISGKLPSYRMPTVKHAAGYFVKPGMDLIDLVIGSEGTLGIVTEATLRLIRPPARVLAGIAFFSREEDSWRFVTSLEPFRTKAYPHFSVRALEYFDPCSLDMLRPAHGRIPGNAKAAIWYELETDPSRETSALENWAEYLEKHSAFPDSWFGTGEKEQALFRKFRHDLPVTVNEQVVRNGLRKVATDFAVPAQKLPDMMKTYRQLAEEARIPYVIFGHIGDGHLHWNLLPKTKAEFEKSWALYRTAAGKAIALGGTVSAEHGIGKVKIPYLELLYGKSALKQMAQLKLSFDPQGLLGRGNMFPESFLPAAG